MLESPRGRRRRLPVTPITPTSQKLTRSDRRKKQSAVDSEEMGQTPKVSKERCNSESPPSGNDHTPETPHKKPGRPFKVASRGSSVVKRGRSPRVSIVLCWSTVYCV